MKPVSLPAFVFFLVAPFLQAGDPYLVKDVNVKGTPLSSEPRLFSTIGSTTYFAANDGIHGTELWKTDGTEAGTSMVKDIAPGGASGMSQFAMTAGSRLVFAAADEGATQMWSTDGTEAGTRKLTAVDPGAGWSFNPSSGLSVGDVAYFFGTSTPGGRELWRTDGTVEGTRMVYDLRPPVGSQAPRAMGVIGNSFLFYAVTPEHSGIFITDGTSAGTKFVAPGSPIRPFSFGNALLYTVEESGAFALYRTDGTSAGTMRLRGGLPTRAAPITLVGAGALAYFVASVEGQDARVWRTDGTPAGTSVLAELPFGSKLGARPYLTVVGSTLFFFVETQTAWQLWKSDGTAEGTILIRDGLAEPGGAFAFKDRFYFLLLTGHGPDFWRSDGTAAGTEMVHNFGSGMLSLSLEPLVLASGGNSIIFPGSDATHGVEPWISDGTSSGTRMIRNVRADSSFSSSPFSLAARDGNLMFMAQDGDGGTSLWTSDGTAPGTFRVSTEAGEGRSAVAGKIYYFTKPFPSLELWRSDGTAAGTFSLGIRDVHSFVPFRDGLVFFGTEPEHGTELWFSDGTLAGTRLIRDASQRAAGPLQSHVPPVASGGKLYFASRAELWSWNGIDAAPQKVTELTNEIRTMTDVGGTLYLAVLFHLNAFDLYRTDGTAAGTVKVKRIESPPPAAMVNVAGTLFFMLQSPLPGQLWKSDGTESGTDIVTWHAMSYCTFENFAVIGKTLFWYRYISGSRFGEVWRSDGTAAGTYAFVRYFVPPAISSFPDCLPPRSLAAARGNLYFTGYDPLHGVEPWISDGTTVGTRLLSDLNPGPANSDPGQFFHLGDLLYFAANDGFHGKELWAHPVPETPPRRRSARR